MRVPKWINCKECNNKNTVYCISCIVKYETAPYLNYSYKRVTVTDTTVIK